jgi:glycogen debranching enzyme
MTCCARRAYVLAPATRVEGNAFEFLLEFPPGASDELFIEAGPRCASAPSRARHRAAAAQAQRRMRARGRRGARVRSSGPLFDAWMQRSRADLALLTSELETGPYPYAGIPWFSTPFGRDAVVTALQTLWLDPGIARGVLGSSPRTRRRRSRRSSTPRRARSCTRHARARWRR